MISLCSCLPATALGAPTATLRAALRPERLGAPTTVSADLTISSGGADLPVLSGVQLSYPANLGFVTSGLGLAACAETLLAEDGPQACPANSHVGSGSAVVEIPLSEGIREPVALTLLAGPSPGGSLHVLVSAFGARPVSALVVFSAQLGPGVLDVSVPQIPTFPEGPFVSVTAMHLELGGRLTYYERVRGRSVAYHPAGIGLPRTCPAGGFRFGATFTFLDGERSSAETRVGCPRTGRN